MAVCKFFCVIPILAAEECDDGTTKACAAGKDTAAKNTSARAVEIDEGAVPSLLLLVLVGARRRTVMVAVGRRFLLLVVEMVGAGFSAKFTYVPYVRHFVRQKNPEE